MIIPDNAPRWIREYLLKNPPWAEFDEDGEIEFSHIELKTAYEAGMEHHPMTDHQEKIYRLLANVSLCLDKAKQPLPFQGRDDIVTTPPPYVDHLTQAIEALKAVVSELIIPTVDTPPVEETAEAITAIRNVT